MTKTIAIIGAGCAGLGAAAAFMETDADLAITLIDANDWLGGRARTSSVPGLPVDLGPQFIQDPEINPWAKIMAAMPGYSDLKVQPISMNAAYRARMADDSWQTIPGNKGIRATQERLTEQYEKAAQLLNAPIMTGNAPEFCKGQQDIRLGLGASYLGAIAESAEPWQYVVSDQVRQQDFPSDGNIYVPGGLGTMVQKYGEALVAGNRKRLSFLNDTALSIDGTDVDKLTIGLKNKGAFDCHYCIVSIPAGAIENIKLAPPLPDDIIAANSFIKLGSYKKVAFRPTSFPEVGPNSIDIKSEYYLYDEENDGVWQYFRLPTDECILICVAAGDFARALDGGSDKEAADIIIGLLGKAHPGGDFTPRQGAIVVTNWTATPNIHGAYSYTQYDSALGFEDPLPLAARTKIAEPYGRIHFAGEATWTKAYGTIHGAYLSGQRAAGEILAIIKG